MGGAGAVVTGIINAARWAAQWAWNAAAEAWRAAIEAWKAWITPIVTWLKGIVSGWVIPTLKSLWDFVYGWIKPIVDWLKPKVLALWEIWTKHIRPKLEWILSRLEWLSKKLDNVFFRLWNQINLIYNQLFGWIEDLRNKLRRLSMELQKVASVFSKKLAEKIAQVHRRIDDSLKAVSTRLRKEILNRIHETYMVLRTRIDNATAALRNVLGQAREAIRVIDNGLRATIERPGLLRRETIQASTRKYGAYYLEGLDEATTPRPAERELELVVVGETWKVIERTIELIAKGTEEAWADVHRAIDQTLEKIEVGGAAWRDLTLEGIIGPEAIDREGFEKAFEESPYLFVSP